MIATTSGLMCVKNSRKSDLNSRIGTSLWSVGNALEECEYVGFPALTLMDCAMIHGHGTAQGVYFPHAGVRTSDDTAILFSPESIANVILPIITRSAAPFGGAFAHFCGRSEDLFQQLCRSASIKAIDVQSGMHSAAWLLEQCAEHDTVLYSRIEGNPGESWKSYVDRIGGLVRSTGARCILRPTVFPTERSACAAMLDRWRELTAQ